MSSGFPDEGVEVCVVFSKQVDGAASRHGEGNCVVFDSGFDVQCIESSAKAMCGTNNVLQFWFGEDHLKPADELLLPPWVFIEQTSCGGECR